LAFFFSPASPGFLLSSLLVFPLPGVVEVLNFPQPALVLLVLVVAPEVPPQLSVVSRWSFHDSMGLL
jgi:hypothetical protein